MSFLVHSLLVPGILSSTDSSKKAETVQKMVLFEVFDDVICVSVTFMIVDVVLLLLQSLLLQSFFVVTGAGIIVSQGVR